MLTMVIGVTWIVLVICYTVSGLTEEPGNKPISNPYTSQCEEMSLVYTWVNGSDPAHIESRVARSGDNRYAAPGNSRFRDLGGLKYSLRSAEKFAPWIKKIFIVSDQAPGFLNLDNPMIELISHARIFKNKRDLPTFSSNAIEGNFHNLPDDVGPCFIYLNDDMFFANDVFPSDFWSPDVGQILYESSWTAPAPKEKMNNVWHKSIVYSNDLLSSIWGKARRHYASHGPYFFSLAVLRHLYETFPSAFDATSGHPFRMENDTSLPFLYHQFTLHNYKSYVASQTINSYMKIVDDLPKVRKDFKKIKENRPKTVCMNDALPDNPKPEVIEEMNEFFLSLFPVKSTFEK